MDEDEGGSSEVEPEIPVHVFSEDVTFTLNQVRAVGSWSNGGFNCYFFHLEAPVRILGGQIDFSWVPDSPASETLFVEFAHRFRGIEEAHGQSPLLLDLTVDDLRTVEWEPMDHPNDRFKIYAVLGQQGVGWGQQIDVKINIEYQSNATFETSQGVCA